MVRPFETRAASLLQALEHVLGALPPEVRRQIDDVNTGKLDVQLSSEDERAVSQAIELLATHFDETDFDTIGSARMPIALSWWTIVNRQARAIKRLSEAGMAFDAVPNVRMSFEYSMALITLSKGNLEEVMLALMSQLMNDLSNLNKLTRQSGSEFGDAIAKTKGDIESAVVEPWQAGFSKRASLLEVDSRAVYYYAMQSMLVHPTLVGVAAFTDMNLDGRVTREAIPAFEAITGHAVLWALQCQCWSALAIDHIADGCLPWSAALHEIVERFHIPFADLLFPSA